MMNYPKLLEELTGMRTKVYADQKGVSYILEKEDFDKLIEMTKEFYDDLKKVKYALNSGDEKMIKLLPKAIDEVLEKYSDKPKDYLDSDEFDDYMISICNNQVFNDDKLKLLKETIRKQVKEWK